MTVTMSLKSSGDTRTYGELYSLEGLSPEAKAMVELEKVIPTQIEKDLNLRIKVVNECGHACIFCHNEGTRANTNQTKDSVSIFLPKGSGFEAENMGVDERFIEEMVRIREIIGTKEVHLTGGEPTLNKDLPTLVFELKKHGFRVKMTSNGETGGDIYSDLAKAGLDSVNISIFGSTPEEYAETQPKQYGIEWAKNKLTRSKQAIAGARASGIEVKANCVMTSSKDEERIIHIISRSEEEKFALRILNNLNSGESSIIAIYNLLSKLGAIPKKKKIVAGSSTCSVCYLLPNGTTVWFKQIRKIRLKGVCDNCVFDKKGKCAEGYYGMRLYKDKTNGKYKIGICIQRMDDCTLETDEFFSSRIPQEIINQREAEYQALLRK